MTATTAEIAQLAATLAKLAEKLASREEPETKPTRPLPERLLLTVEEAAEYLGVGRTLMYQLIKDQEIETIRIHRLRRVPREAVTAYARRIMSAHTDAA
ncbi:excisionase family DNA-binding protein [Amycolatopsis magusensis]|uniref:excisionase family DNA-binding protein n=1 Tax=Amycolatopsis magusensis TaxID=882444 RepID=UPI00378E36FD